MPCTYPSPIPHYQVLPDSNVLEFCNIGDLLCVRGWPLPYGGSHVVHRGVVDGFYNDLGNKAVD